MDYTKKLKGLLKEATELEKEVIEDALNAEEAKSYLQDVLRHGCQSGMVSGLIYYHDTKLFYIKHIDEIDELRGELEDSIGEPLKIGFPSYNWLAWFGYAETARKIADKIGLEY